MDLQERDRLCETLFFFGIAVFAALIFWLNFHGDVFYNFDMYSDQLVSRLMAEEHSLFPSGWVFGNQYYVIATPALAALLSPLFPDSFQAMAAASCLMFLLILLAFCWAFRPFLSRTGLLAGLFCLSGAAMIGESASSAVSGLQLYYTMASYYACYVLSFFFHIGCYLRLRRGTSPAPWLWACALALDLALGMQSPRETLVLNLPLAAVESLAFLSGRGRKKAALFVVLCLAVNLAGRALIRFCPVQSSPIISPVKLELAPEALWTHWEQTNRAFLQMTSIAYLGLSWKWKPIGLLALCAILAVAAALIRIAVRRDRSPAAFLPLFCLLSLLGVYVVGIFLFRVRDIYFFVWPLLVSACCGYLMEKLPRRGLRRLAAAALLSAGLVSAFYNFYPDLVKVPELRAYYDGVTERLVREDVRFLYVDLQTLPTAAACSRDRIDSATFYYAFDRDRDPLLRVTSYLRPVGLMENADPEHTRIVLSESPFIEPSSREYLESLAPEDYLEKLRAALVLERVEEGRYNTLYIYRCSDPSLLS